jgi:SAM-dependent methyltransferase
MASPKPEEVGRLQSTFQNTDVSAHGPKWDALWKESYTPWDRGGPSLALADLAQERGDLFPPAKDGKRGTALVPGCGRGYDVLLLSALGYDVVGLDYSDQAVRQAATNEQSVREGKDKEVYDGVSVGERGTVTWVQGDFFDDAWLDRAGSRHFDVIFDYTVSYICQCYFYGWTAKTDVEVVLLRLTTRGTP